MLLRVTLSFFSSLLLLISNAQLHGTLAKGRFDVGFKVIDLTDDNKPFRICIWYPANEKGPSMKLSDYVDQPSIGGNQEKATLRNDLKSTTLLIFDEIKSIPQPDFDVALGTSVWATRDATMQKGKWPLIISDTEPVSLLVTNEWFASQGFIVAVPAMMYPAPADERNYYTAPTKGLGILLDHMLDQSYVDSKNVFAFGFGGGSMAAFFLGMKSPIIKAMADIEGGLFMPASKTTLSPDYKPTGFAVPLLHIVTPSIISGESVDEFNVIPSRRYRLTELKQLVHHDFTIYGRMINGLLKMRGPGSALADAVFKDIHQQVLYFFQNQQPDEAKLKTSEYFKLEVF